MSKRQFKRRYGTALIELRSVDGLRPDSCNLEVLGAHVGRAVSCMVVFGPEIYQIFSQSGLAVSVKSSKGHFGRAEILAKVIDDLRGPEREGE